LTTNSHWLVALRIYIATTVTADVIWEVVQLPLYTIWNTSTRQEIAFAVLHCTMGDLMIATLSLLTALLLMGDRAWPRERFIPVLIATVIIGLSYTVYSEWLNTVVRQTWAYSNLMPKLPPFGTGLSPFLQWIIIPSLGFAAISHFLLTSRVHSLT
jgi:hypothetical protein